VPLNPEQLGNVLKPTHRVWAELEHATLHHKNGWVLYVQEVRFRPPYCTLITRVLNAEGGEKHFNSEAFSKGIFLSIDVAREREQRIEQALVKDLDEQQKTDQAKQHAAEQHKARLFAEAAERAAKMQEAEAAVAAEIEALRQAEEKKRFEARAAASKRMEDWRKCLALRKVTRLTHFTPLPNLPSILQRGLYPATDFRELPEQPLRNDMERYDQRLDHVSLSVSHPNDQLFMKWYAYVHKDYTWVVLSVDPAVLWELPCSMFFANAAKDGGRTPVTESEQPLASDFEKLFVELPDGPIRSELGLTPMDTTSPQAEVMIRAKIAPRYIMSIAARSDADLGKVSELIGARENGPPLLLERWLFDMRPYASRFPKTAGARQLANPLAPVSRINTFEDDIPF
jgi:hypothetical protein